MAYKRSVSVKLTYNFSVSLPTNLLYHQLLRDRYRETILLQDILQLQKAQHSKISLQYHMESMPLIEEIPPNQVTFKNIILEHVGLQE